MEPIYSVMICHWSAYDNMWIPVRNGGTIAWDRTQRQARELARARNKGLGRMARKHLRILPVLQDEVEIHEAGRLALAA